MRILDVGTQALLVEVADLRAAQRLYRAVQRLVDAVTDANGDGGTRRDGLRPPGDVVPAARTVLLDGLGDPSGWRRLLEAGLPDATDTDSRNDETAAADRREVVVPVRYDGPDLAAVAEAWGCDGVEVARRHTATVFSVAFCGFAPGFAYCTSDPTLPEVPRRQDPRTRVPTGSVALAGPYCGIYPRAMPGGWQLVGTTPVQLFDPDRDQPALLAPGDTVRFEVEP